MMKTCGGCKLGNINGRRENGGGRGGGNGD